MLIAGSLLSCTNKSKLSGKVPVISYTGLSGNQIKAGSNQKIILEFSFSDGDGDLGNTPSSGNFDIYTTDSRDTAPINYFFPKDMPKAVNTQLGISGICTLAIEGEFLLLRPDRPAGDTVKYEVYIKDRAGNESNRFTTPEIYILP